MQNTTVQCGCGRKMGVDALRGKGAFRCGCGTRVKVIVPRPRPLCMGPVEDGSQCVHRVVPESQEHGLTLCADHFDRYQKYLRTLERERKDRELDEQRRRQRNLDERSRKEKALDDARREGRMVVYYVRIGDKIKIGTTTSFKYRMISLMPDEILATEPGHVELERLRHKQFEHLHVPPGRERFRADPELMAHIAMLLDHYGPPTDRYPPEVVATKVDLEVV